MSLRIKTTLCLLAIIVLLVALVQLYFGNAIRSVLVRHTNEYQSTNFNYARSGVEQIMEQIGVAANALSFNEKIVAMANALDKADHWTRYENNTFLWQEMRSVRNVMLSQYTIDLSIATPGGSASYIDHESMEALPYDEIIREPWYDQLERDGTNSLWLTPAAMGAQSPSASSFFTYVQTLWGEQLYATSRGLLMINIEVSSSFQKILDGVDAPEGSSLYLFDGDRRLICSTENTRLGAMMSGFDFSHEISEVFAQMPMSFQYDSEHGLAHGNVAAIRGSDWTLVQTMPYEVLFQETNEIQKWFIYIVILMGAGVMFFAMLATTPTLQALSKVVRRTKRIAQGDFESRLNIKRKDEVGELALAVDQMAADISKLLVQLHEENELRNRLNLERLKNQLDPHFLFNALNSIKCIAALNEYDVICRMITDLSYLLESALGKNDEFITLREELEFTSHYVALQRIRFNDFDYALDIDETVLDIMVPRLILQPLIENAIKHGFLNNPINGEILFSAHLENGFLLMTIEDNGAGMTAGQIETLMHAEKATGENLIGLNNIRTRLMLYYGQSYFSEMRAMEIGQNAKGGLTIAIRIPINKEKDEIAT